MSNNCKTVASRCDRIAPFHVMALLARAQELAAQGRDIVHLEIGEPDFVCPAAVVAAGQVALANGKTRYTPAQGIAELRTAIAADYAQRYKVTLNPERILLTPGASGAIQLALAALVEPGDGVLLTDPGYPCNRHFVELVNGDVQLLNTSADNGFKVTAQALAAAWQGNTRATLLASPDNPTGQVLSRDELVALAEVTANNGGWLLMDEIYQGLCPDAQRLSILSVTDDVIVINSFSKYFSMTGWRLGWLVVPEALIGVFRKLAQNFFLAPSTPAQYAALALFDEEVQAELLARRDEFERRRRYCLAALKRLGLPVVGAPVGAFYIYVDVSSITTDSFALCERLLEDTGVALTPGLDFGSQHRPERYLRLAYTVAIERLEEAFSRLEKWLETSTN